VCQTEREKERSDKTERKIDRKRPLLSKEIGVPWSNREINRQKGETKKERG
jgi:hypothetical protein